MTDEHRASTIVVFRCKRCHYKTTIKSNILSHVGDVCRRSYEVASIPYDNIALEFHDVEEDQKQTRRRGPVPVNVFAEMVLEKAYDMKNVSRWIDYFYSSEGCKERYKHVTNALSTGKFFKFISHALGPRAPENLRSVRIIHTKNSKYIAWKKSKCVTVRKLTQGAIYAFLKDVYQLVFQVLNHFPVTATEEEETYYTGKYTEFKVACEHWGEEYNQYDLLDLLNYRRKDTKSLQAKRLMNIEYLLVNELARRV